ncbi:MAG TPA: hypothetical protein VGF55_14900 [Gemmataceae bacterium]|jgi:hypothetical protein
MRRSFASRFGLLFVLMPALAPGSVVPDLRADDPPAGRPRGKPADIAPPTAEELAGERMKFMKMALSHFTVQVDERKEPATVADPCLRWTNPIGGAPDGVVAVYARKGGRPAALGQVFLNFQKKWVNEFTIIPESDVTIQRSGRLFWKPSEYVCKFTDLPRSPRPVDKAVARLAQMRGIAADFSVIDYFRSKTVKQDLRLLPQPVYRYSEAGTILDGAVFIFVMGTDPECCLFMEAYRDGKGIRYRYAVAPMSIYQLEVHYQGNLVWAIDPRSPAGDKSRVYYAGVYSPEPGEVLPE